MKREIKEWIIGILGIIVAGAIFYGLFCLFLIMARDADDPEQREVVIDLPGAGAPSADDAEEADVEEADEPRYTIYQEGIGEPPIWYQPDEKMSVEWYADEEVASYQQIKKSNNEADSEGKFATRFATQQVKLQVNALQSDPVDYNASVDWMLNVPLSAEFQTFLYGLCVEEGIPYTLAVAVIEAESTYCADAISPSGDYGLMQINEVCHEWLADELGITDFLDPWQSARAGIWLLADYYARYGYASGALMCYNMGETGAKALFDQGIYSTAYSERVIGIQYRLETEGG